MRKKMSSIENKLLFIEEELNAPDDVVKEVDHYFKSRKLENK